MNSDNPDPIPNPDEFSGSKTYAMSGKIMLSAIIILFFVVVLMIFLHLYARWYLLRARRRHLRRRSHTRRATMVFFATDASVVVSRGLNPNVIKSLPIFTFSEETHKDSIECAVCLSEFEEGESGRVLPNCKHTFHVDCIDMWFHSHSTCPLCRSLVEIENISAATSEDQVVISIPSDPISAIEPGSSSGLSEEPRGSGSTEDLSRKPAAIEVPRRNYTGFEDDLTRRDSPVSQSFRSPMSRMLSFTRMLSRERRSVSSPISGASPQSSSSSCQIPMAELDIERDGKETRS